MSHNMIVAPDFSKKVLKSLAKKNIFVIGTQLIPDNSSSMPWANAIRGYVLSVEGQGQVKTYLEVEALAK